MSALPRSDHRTDITDADGIIFDQEIIDHVLGLHYAYTHRENIAHVLGLRLAEVNYIIQKYED